MGNIQARQLRCFPMAILCFMVAAAGLWAQSSKPTDYQVKAAYLYNFGRFIEWPPTAASAKNDSFMVCVLGRDPFGATLDSALAGEIISGKHVVARRISNLQESANCQILFLSADEDGRLKQVIETLNKEAVLTVSDIPKFSQRGGMIQFVLEGNRIRFEVNLTATQHAGLTMSSELLKVASAVRKDPASGD
jgi:YfiR/HmsC-like